MKIKILKEYLILVIIIVALMLYLILRPLDRTQYQLPQAVELAKDTISKVEVSQASKTLVLEKKDNRWQIAPQKYAADTDKVKEMLALIESLSMTALVSESKDYFRYDLGEDKKITVKAWAGETLLRGFDIGKTASSFQHTFVKIADDHRVYHARKNFRRLFDQTIDDLRDKTVLTLDKAAITQFQVMQGTQTITFNRQPIAAATQEAQPPQDIQKDKQTPPPAPAFAWISTDGRKGDTSKIDRILSTLADLKCAQYIYNRPKTAFKDPIYVITLKDTQPYTLSIFAKADAAKAEYPAVSSANESAFLLQSWNVDNINIPIADLMAGKKS